MCSGCDFQNSTLEGMKVILGLWYFVNGRYQDTMLLFTPLQVLAPVFVYVFTLHMHTYFSLSSYTCLQ